MNYLTWFANTESWGHRFFDLPTNKFTERIKNIMMFFNKKRSSNLPLGIFLGAAAGIVGITALAASNKEMRKTMGKEWEKCCRKGTSAVDKLIFAMK